MPSIPAHPAFLSAAPLRPLRSPCISNTTTTLSTARPHVFKSPPPPSMLQSPNSDGPPSLDAFDSARRATSAMSGPPVLFATARISIDGDHDYSSVDKAANDCVINAFSQFPDHATARLIHATFTPDLNPQLVAAGLLRAAGQIQLMARSVAKKGGTPKTIEVLVLGGGTNIYTGFSAPSSSERDAPAAMGEAFRMARASEGFNASQVIFGLFVSSHDEEGVRQVLGSNLPMYGGRASEGETGAIICGKKVITEGNGAAVALVNGSASFLISAVVKSWAQPAFVDALSFLKPTYTGDAGEDLLQAIKFDDCDKFEECLKQVGPNFQWTTRQHQTPLLAAAGRGRTHMVQRILDEGGDVRYRNDGGFNAVMYTLRLRDYGDEFVEKQLGVLEKAGADLDDTEVIYPEGRT